MSINRIEKHKILDEVSNYKNKLFKEPVLQQIAIELTLDCNCYCKHCGSKCGELTNKDLLTDKEILSFLENLSKDLKEDKKKKPFIFVTGGEPLLRKNVANLMYEVKKLGYSWGMTTNGMMINKEVAKDLKDAGIYSIGISIDGLKETHDWFRQVPGCFDRAVAGIKNMVEMNIGNVMVTTVIHKKNINELEELYLLMKELKINTWRVINLEPIGRALENKDLMLDGNDYKYLFNFIKEKNSKDLEVAFGCNHFLGLDLEYEVRPWFFLCQSGIRIASIQSNGDITGCLDIRRGDSEAGKKIIQGNIRTDNFYDVWKNKFEIFRKPKATNSKNCKDCIYLKECDGGGFHTWNFDENKPYICMLDKLNVEHDIFAK